MQASPRLRKNVTSPDAEAGPTPRKDAAMAQRSARSAVPKSPLAGASSSKRKVVILGSVLTVVALGAVFAGLFFTGVLNGVLGIARPQSEADQVRVEQSKNLGASSYCALHDGELGLAKLYNLFVEETIFARATDVEGRIAAGGSINVAQFGVGTKLTGDCSTYRPEFAALGRNDLSNYTIVTDYFQANGIGVKHGGIALVHDEGGNYRVSDVENGCGIDTYPENPIDFSAEWSNLVLITQGLAACPDTKSYSARKWAQFFLYVKGEDELEFFNIKESDLTGATEIILVQDPSKGGAPLKSAQTTIIINVIMAGDNQFKKFSIPSMGFTGFDGLENYVLWNFYDYQEISIRRTAWPGTILATEASFEHTSGEIHGTVIARAWNEDQECQVPQSEIHWYPYLGRVFTTDCHPPPTPPPSTKAPTATPSPTKCPTKSPTAQPTKCPTSSPTHCPTHAPTESPTHCPTQAPTESPTHCPTHAPTESPTHCPTHTPTESPTHCPTGTPTSTPAPTKCPTKAPTPCPTKAPTLPPTNCPTKAPTTTPAPTKCPTKAPTLAPTKCPTNAPTTAAPTKCPTPPYTNPPTSCNRGCGTETAFAYSCSCRFSTCFLDISNIKNNRWGWSLGPIAPPYQEFTANLYAGAACCNPLKGHYVGNVRVSFDGDDAIIYIHLSAGVTMSEFHIYFGTTQAPVDPANADKLTVAPGQYPRPYSNEQLTSAVSGDYTYRYTGATCGGKTVYFIFHAITNGC